MLYNYLYYRKFIRFYIYIIIFNIIVLKKKL